MGYVMPASSSLAADRCAFAASDRAAVLHGTAQRLAKTVARVPSSAVASAGLRLARQERGWVTESWAASLQLSGFPLRSGPSACSDVSAHSTVLGGVEIALYFQ